MKDDHQNTRYGIEEESAGDAAVPISRRQFLNRMGIGSAAVALGATGLLAGCEQQGQEQEAAQQEGGQDQSQGRAGKSQISLTWVAQQQSAQSGQRALEGFRAHVKSKNLNWDVTVTDAKGDPGTLSKMVTDAATRGSDAIIVAFGTLTAAQGALNNVKEAEIPFFSLDSGYFPPAICDIASNNYAIGGKMSEYMVQRLLGQGKDKAKICTITANFHHGTRKRGKVRDAVLSENEWIEVLADRVIQYANFYELTQNTTNDWLTRFGDEIDAIWCPWDEPATAAATAIKNSGRDVNDTFVVGADGHPPAVKQIRDDSSWPFVATPAQSFELWGALAAYFVDEIVGKGRPVEEVVPVPIVEVPAPMIVQGTNVPPEDKMPWEATDFYYTFEEKAKESVS